MHAVIALMKQVNLREISRAGFASAGARSSCKHRNEANEGCFKLDDHSVYRLTKRLRDYRESINIQ
jgi:hypothetical protein